MRRVRAVLIDLGGVLVTDLWPRLAQDWGSRLGVTPEAFLAALYQGSDTGVLIGRLPEAAWWDVVAALGLDGSTLAEITADIAARERWDLDLVAALRRVAGRAGTAIVSNAWPSTRQRIAAAGYLDLADELVLSSEVGCAKPDPAIFEIALGRLAAEPADALFIDDQAQNVAAAAALGLTAHRHAESAETVAVLADFVSRR